MSEPLTLKYRPRRFTDVVGQAHAKVVLRQMILKGLTPPPLIFSGSRGTGKTTMARILAAALNCEAADPMDKPCMACPACEAIVSGTGVDVVEVDAASNGNVDDVRRLKDLVSYGQTGAVRVVLLDECHSMSKAGFQALLKVLEEPPPQTLFILLTTEPGKIPDTILSRCMVFEFRRHTIADITARLRFIAATEQIAVGDDVLELVAQLADGGMRDAVMLLEQTRYLGAVSAEQFRTYFAIESQAPAFISAVLDADFPAGAAAVAEHFERCGDLSQLLVDLSAWVRDLLVLSAGGRVDRSESELAELQRSSARGNAGTWAGCMKVLWDLAKARNLSGRASADVAFAMMVDKTGAIPEAAVPKLAVAAPLGLSDMVAMAGR